MNRLVANPSCKVGWSTLARRGSTSRNGHYSAVVPGGVRRWCRCIDERESALHLNPTIASTQALCSRVGECMRKFETCEVWGMDFEPSHASLWCGARALHAIVQGSGFLIFKTVLLQKCPSSKMDAHIVVARSCTHAQWHKGGQSVCSPSFPRPSGWSCPGLSRVGCGLVLSSGTWITLCRTRHPSEGCVVSGIFVLMRALR